MSIVIGGIAGFFGPGDDALLRALGTALSHRGASQVVHTGDGFGLIARSEQADVAVDERGVAVVAAGQAPQRLLTRYLEGGAPKLGRRPGMAVAVADPTSSTLVLARAGGFPLYYARRDGGGVVFASEPGVLLAAGVVTAEADLATVRRFVLTGASDDLESTFYAGIRAVPDGDALVFQGDEVVEVALSGVDGPPVRVRDAIAEAFGAGQQAAVRLGGGLPGAVLTALAPEPMAVLSASFRPLDPSEDQYSEALLPLVAAGVKHQTVEVNTDTLVADLPAVLAVAGEPFASLESYVQYVAARDAAALGADVLVDPAGALAAFDLALPPVKRPRRVIDPASLVRIPAEAEEDGPELPGEPGSVERAAERFAARTGIRIETPFRRVTGTPGELAELLPAPAIALAGAARPAVPARDWLLRLKNRIYGVFLEEAFVNRGWFDQQAVMVAFEDFIKGRNADAELFWRIWCVEMWAREMFDAKPVLDDAEPVHVKGPLEANANKQLEITVDGQEWLRFPIRTDLFISGDPYQERIAGYVRDFVRAALADGSYASNFEQPWYVLVSEKIVAISQGRSYFIWDIEPSWWARVLQRFVVRTPYGIGLGSPWTMELALREAGLPRILLASVVSAAGKLVGKRGLFYQIAGPGVRSIDGPTEYSVFPANVSAKLGPAKPHEVAAELTERVRTELEQDGLTEAKTLAGVVVIDANDIGRNVLGLHADRPGLFFEELFADNPLGQGSEQTPVAVAVRK